MLYKIGKLWKGVVDIVSQCAVRGRFEGAEANKDGKNS